MDETADDNLGNVGHSLSRKMVPVTGVMTDEQWTDAAQSCERLDPGAPTVLRVYRPFVNLEW